MSDNPHFRLRVAIVAPSLRILGGQAVQAHRLLEAWRHDPEVEAWLVPVNPVPVRPFDLALNVSYLRTIVTQLAYWPSLVRELRRADVVHVFSASYFSFVLAPLPAILVSWWLKKPVVLNYRSGEAPDHLARSALARWTLRRVDRNIVPSQFLRDVFAGFDIRTDVIPNIVDLERFRYRDRRPLAPRLLSTRNFESLYNVACTLKAFARVQARFPDAALTLVGDGRERPRLQALVSELGLRHVRFAGRVPPADIHRWYDEADIYVQTPDIDNMPSSVLEAYASGLAVVSTDAGGVSCILRHEQEGLLAPRGDDEAVGSAILRLLESPELASRVTAGGRSYAARCTWELTRAQWLQVYRGLARPDTAGEALAATAP